MHGHTPQNNSNSPTHMQHWAFLHTMHIPWNLGNRHIWNLVTPAQKYVHKHTNLETTLTNPWIQA